MAAWALTNTMGIVTGSTDGPLDPGVLRALGLNDGRPGAQTGKTERSNESATLNCHLAERFPIRRRAPAHACCSLAIWRSAFISSTFPLGATRKFCIWKVRHGNIPSAMDRRGVSW